MLTLCPSSFLLDVEGSGDSESDVTDDIVRFPKTEILNNCLYSIIGCVFINNTKYMDR